MFNVVASIKYIDVNDCFLHLSPKLFAIFMPVYKCVKLSLDNGGDVFYFSIHAVQCNSLNENGIGLNSKYANNLKLHLSDSVILSPISTVSSIKSIFTKPVLLEDFEILETVTEAVESLLLNQLRVVWPKQCFPVWVSSGLSVNLTVESIEPDVEFGWLEEDSEVVVGGERRPREELPTVEERWRVVPAEPCMFGVGIPPYTVYPSRALTRGVWRLDHNGTCLHVDVMPHPRTGPPVLLAPHHVRAHLTLLPGALVSVTPVIDSPAQITGILISPCFDLNDGEDTEMLEKIVYRRLLDLVAREGSCLLNSKAVLPLGDGRDVLLTLRPLDLSWARLTPAAVLHLTVSTNVVTDRKPLPVLPEPPVVPHNFFKEAGVELLSELNFSVKHSFGLESDSFDSIVKFIDNTLITGKPRSGKTHLAQIFLGQVSKEPYFLHTETLDCRVLKGKRFENVSKILSDVLNTCKDCQPSVLFLDNLDTLCGVTPPEQEKSEATFLIKRNSCKIVDLIENIQLENFILVIAAAESTTSLNDIFCHQRGKNLFSSVLTIPDLTKHDRHDFLLNCFTNKVPYMESCMEALNLGHFASATEGFVVGDLVSLVEKTIFEAWQRTPIPIDSLRLILSDIEQAYEFSRSSQSLKSKKGREIKLCDIGGLKSAKLKLTEIILWPSMYAEILNQCPLKKQCSALLFGAPGTGKTLLARAIAGESGLNFITVKGPELMSKYIGESEEGVRKVFRNAQSARPSLIFFDEFESLAPRRGVEQTGVTDRVVNQLLTALDGVEPMSGVSVLAASSRPDLIDPALLRPGRIGSHIFLPLPDQSERVEILGRLSSELTLDEDVNLSELAELTEGFSGADLKGLLSTCQIQIADEIADSSLMSGAALQSGGQREVVVRQADLLAALDQSKPALQPSQARAFQAIYENFMKGSSTDVTRQKVTFA